MKTKTVTTTVWTPPRGERPRRQYHSVMSYALGYVEEERDTYREGMDVDVEIRMVPDNLTPEDVKTAAQGLIDLGGGLPNPSAWDRDIAEPLKRKGYVLEPGKKLREAKA